MSKTNRQQHKEAEKRHERLEQQVAHLQNLLLHMAPIVGAMKEIVGNDMIAAKIVEIRVRNAQEQTAAEVAAGRLIPANKIDRTTFVIVKVTEKDTGVVVGPREELPAELFPSFVGSEVGTTLSVFLSKTDGTKIMCCLEVLEIYHRVPAWAGAPAPGAAG